MSIQPDEITETPVRFAARDGYELAGTLVRGPQALKGGALMSSATGYRKEYYLRFAKMGAAKGFACLVYDGRGIGGSAPDDLAAFQADCTDWGRYDAPAAVDVLAADIGDRPIVHVGHSVGGHFVGLWDNHDRVSAHAFICVGSGYWGRHAWWYRPLGLWFWHGWGRYSIARHGYVRRGGGWTGEPLPKGVFDQWRKWSHQPGYLSDDLDTIQNNFDAVTAPIASWIYSDDPIANESTAKTILELYPAADKQLLKRTPKDYGLKAIGHNGPFRAVHAPAAEEVWAFLETHAAKATR